MMHIFRLFEIHAGEDGHNFVESFIPFSEMRKYYCFTLTVAGLLMLQIIFRHLASGNGKQVNSLPDS